MYMGVPIHFKHPTPNMFKKKFKKMHRKLVDRKTVNSHQKTCLVKLVLVTIPTYLFCTDEVSVGQNGSNREVLWTNDPWQKMDLVSGSDICSDFLEGGLKVYSICDFYRALEEVS